MEVVMGIILAIVGMVWSFFKGKDSQRSEDRKKKLEGIDDKARNVEREIQEIEEQLDDNQARDRTPEEAIRILRERHGWGPTDDHAP